MPVESFKGAKPADLLVLQSTKFEFLINLQTAKVLVIEVHESTFGTKQTLLLCEAMFAFGVKRTSYKPPRMSAPDPKRTILSNLSYIKHAEHVAVLFMVNHCRVKAAV